MGGRWAHVKTMEERFWYRVEPEPNSGCWLWNGATSSAGYGQISFPRTKRLMFAHRFAFELLAGPIPAGTELDHLCRVPSCVNPAHLEPVTHRVNMLRGNHPMAIAIRTGLCKRGHDLSLASITRRGTRRCKLCRRTAA